MWDPVDVESSYSRIEWMDTNCPFVVWEETCDFNPLTGRKIYVCPTGAPITLRGRSLPRFSPTRWWTFSVTLSLSLNCTPELNLWSKFRLLNNSTRPHASFWLGTEVPQMSNHPFCLYVFSVFLCTVMFNASHDFPFLPPVLLIIVPLSSWNSSPRFKYKTLSSDTDGTSQTQPPRSHLQPPLNPSVE